MKNTLASIEDALKALGRGEMVVVVDNESRENEGDLVIAAEKVTPKAINFMMTHGRGLICMPMLDSDFKRLGIKMMVDDNQSKYQTAFGVSIGAARGITTGISARDRAYTIQTAINPQSNAQDIVCPGHIFPLRAESQGVLRRQGHTEACVDLARLSGLRPAAVLCEITNADGSMARLPQLLSFAKRHHLLVISIDDLVDYRYCKESLLEEVAKAPLPLSSGAMWTIKVFQSSFDQQEITVLIASTKSANLPLIRLHSACLTGDVFGSKRCDCGWQLQESIRLIEQQGGAIIYLQQEGRGIGLANKIKAYALQQSQGLDTVEANHALGFAADQREYVLAAQALKALGLSEVMLLSNNPKKEDALVHYGIHVAKVLKLQAPIHPHNANYLKTKQHKLGHRLLLPQCIRRQNEGQISDGL